MTVTKSNLKVEVVGLIAKKYADSLLYGQANPWIHLDDIERDKRKRKNAARAYAEDGLVVWTDGAEKVYLTRKAYDGLTEAKPDLLAHWDKFWGHKTRPECDFVPINGLSLAERKYVLEHEGEYDFLIVYENVTRYNCQPVAGDISGVLALGTLSDEEKMVEAALEARGVRFPRVDVCIRDQTLKAVVADQFHKEVFGRLMLQNLAYALEQRGVPEHVAKLFRAGSKNEPSIFGSDYGNLGDDPAQWGRVLGEEVERLDKRINELRAKMDHFMFAANAVRKSDGGWAGLVQSLQDEVAEHLKKRGQKTENSGQKE